MPCPTSSLYRPGTVFCNGYATKVVEVTNPITGRTWMDRNLGASRAATSSTDTLAYGDLYQWGRGADGHQCRNSDTITIKSTSDVPGHGKFYTGGFLDWREPQNPMLWQGVNGINNPCPNGYRIPTKTEFEDEITSWSNLNGLSNSPFKLPLSSGTRDDSGAGAIGWGYSSFWSSSIFIVPNASLYRPHKLNISGTVLNTGNVGIGIDDNDFGVSVRCIKD
jgi:uncharacterized protein (TIGR02145 family)